MILGGQRQDAGDDSVNAQAGRDVHITVNQGVSASELFNSTRETLEANLVQMRGIAENVFNERAHVFVEQLLNRLNAEGQEAFKRVAEPDFQLDMLDAAKAFGRTGGDELLELLVDMLAAKTRTPPRSLIDLVLSESLNVAPKLSKPMVDNLAAFWILRNVSRQHEATVSEEVVLNWFDSAVAPFIAAWPPSESEMHYLQYLGCGALATGTTSSFQGVLSIKLHDAGVAGESSIPHLLDEPAPALEQFPALRHIRPTWTTQSGINQFYLTSLGIAIAHANYRRIFREAIDLSIWIN